MKLIWLPNAHYKWCNYGNTVKDDKGRLAAGIESRILSAIALLAAHPLIVGTCKICYLLGIIKNRKQTSSMGGHLLLPINLRLCER